MKRLGLYVVLLVVGLLLGYHLRPLPDAAPPVGHPPPAERVRAALETPPGEATPDLQAELERLRAKVAKLEGSLAETRPVRLAEETGDPGVAGIRVIVIDEAGRPRPGLEVGVTRYVNPYRRETGETDAGGRVELADLPPGPVILSIRAPNALRSGSVSLTGGRITEVLVPFPRTGVPVHGVVLDRKSGPVPGVLVGLFRSGGDFQTQHQTRTDEEGRYRFESVPPGAFTLSVLVGDPREGRQPVARILVPRGGALEKDMIVGTRSLLGTVRDAETGRQIVGYSVCVAQPNHILRRSPTEDGEYEFLDLAPGVYRMWARAPGYMRKTRGDVEILAGRTLRIDFELKPAAVLILTVLDREGRPVIGTVGVSVRSGDAPIRSDRLPAGEGGVLRIDEIPPGETEIAIGVAGSGQAKATSTLVPGENRLTIRLE